VLAGATGGGIDIVTPSTVYMDPSTVVDII